MRALFSHYLFLTFLTIFAALSAWSSEIPLGYFRFVAAIDPEIGTTLRLDGQSNKKPMPGGFVSGGVGFPIGMKKLQIDAGRLGTKTVDLDLQVTQSWLVVAYAADRKVADNKPPERRIEALVIPAKKSDGKERQLRALYAAQKGQHLDVQIGSKTMRLEGGKVESAGNYDGTIEVAAEGKILRSLSFEDAANVTFVFYEKNGGESAVAAVIE